MATSLKASGLRPLGLIISRSLQGRDILPQRICIFFVVAFVFKD
jgi:hypothetical protein